MAWTQTDIDTLKRAKASGVLTLRDATGNLVTYRDLAEIDKTLADMEAEVNGRPRRTVATFSNGTRSGSCR